MRDQKEENELRFTRTVIMEMIVRAFLDASGKTEGFKRSNTGNVAKKWQDDAIHFLKSREFEQLCDAIDWPWQAIRREAFVQDRNNRVKDITRRQHGLP
jgi:hypothetical protein